MAGKDIGLSDKEIKYWEEKIQTMSHEEMASFWRFASIGHPLFSRAYNLHERFEKRFREFGGMTPEVSEKIGWRLRRKQRWWKYYFWFFGWKYYCGG